MKKPVQSNLNGLFEQVFINTNMNLYTYHNQPENLLNFEEAQNSIPDIIWSKLYISRYDDDPHNKREGNFKKLETYRHLFAHTAKDAAKFSDKILQGRFLKGEKVIMNNVYFGELYLEFLKEEGIPYKKLLDKVRAGGFK